MMWYVLKYIKYNNQMGYIWQTLTWYIKHWWFTQNGWDSPMPRIQSWLDVDDMVLIWMPYGWNPIFLINDTSRTGEKSPSEVNRKSSNRSWSTMLGRPIFWGGQDIVVAPRLFFGVSKEGGAQVIILQEADANWVCFLKKKLAAKARIPWFYHQTMEHMENTPKSHGWKMLKTSSSPSLYRIELHHIVGLSPILWEKPMSYGCSCVYRIFKYIPYITIHYICSILTHHFRSFYPQKDTRCSQIVASDIHLLLVLSHDPSKSYHNPHCITINIPILMVGVALLYTYITNEGIPIKCGLLYILLHTSHPNYWHPNYSHAIVEFKGILTLIKWGVISQRTQGRVKHIYISQ